MASSHGKFHWNELMTRNVERAKKFYSETLGWTFELDADARRRHLLARQDR